MSKWTKEDDEAIIGCLAILFVFLVIVPVCSLFGAFIIYAAWNWAIAAAFGLHTLTFIQSWLIAMGLSFVGGCFKAKIERGK